MCRSLPLSIRQVASASLQYFAFNFGSCVVLQRSENFLNAALLAQGVVLAKALSEQIKANINFIVRKIVDEISTLPEPFLNQNKETP